MSKSESWWVVVVNFGGVTKPIRCYRPDEYEEHVLWDKQGEYDCDMRAGVWPLTNFENETCTKFQTPSKREAELFYAGAIAVGKILNGLFA